jgi:hypothetical protein
MKKWVEKRTSSKGLYGSGCTLILKIVLVTLITFGLVSVAKCEVFADHYNVTKQQLESNYAHLYYYFHDAFEVDVTEDGYPELFVGFLCGKITCDYLCYKNNGDGTYSYAGSLDLKSGFFQISDTSHNGFNDIIMFLHYSSTEVLRVRYEAVDGEYVFVEQQLVGFEDIPQIDIESLNELNW